MKEAKFQLEDVPNARSFGLSAEEEREREKEGEKLIGVIGSLCKVERFEVLMITLVLTVFPSQTHSKEVKKTEEEQEAMEKCVFCGWYRRSNGPALRFYGIPREPGLKRVKWLYAIGDRELSPKDKYETQLYFLIDRRTSTLQLKDTNSEQILPNPKFTEGSCVANIFSFLDCLIPFCNIFAVCSVHFRQGRPSNDPSHEDFAPHLFLQRSVSQPVAKTLTYLESLANDDDLDEMPSVSKLERSERLHACKPSILRKRRKIISSLDETKKVDQSTVENSQDDSSEKTMQSEVPEVDKRTLKDDIPNIVMFTNPMTGMKKRMKLQHLPRPFVEAVGIKPGQTVIIKRRIRVAKSARNQTGGSDTMENVLEKEENLLENTANITVCLLVDRLEYILKAQVMLILVFYVTA
uniref:Uncharacterized protein n=1 Tax=Setaria digitata TaxID=48799 RepID=A0A915Q849_9BILA